MVLGNTALDRFDVLVIGSGASGRAVAAMLARHGQHVLVLEAGPNYFPGIDQPASRTSYSPGGGQALPAYGNDELKLLHRFQIQPDPLVEPRSFRHQISDGDRLAVGDFATFAKTVGGGATHADLKTPRFQPDDFRMALPGIPTSVYGASAKNSNVHSRSRLNDDFGSGGAPRPRAPATSRPRGMRPSGAGLAAAAAIRRARQPWIAHRIATRTRAT